MWNITHVNIKKIIVWLSFLILMCATPSVANQVHSNISDNQDTTSIICEYISILSPVVVAVVAIFFNARFSNKQIISADKRAEAQRWVEINGKEIEKLEKILGEFHIPYLIRSESNKKLSQHLREKIKDPNFRLLIKLFDQKWFDNLTLGDQAIINEICENGLVLRNFIEDKSWCVDSSLSELLSQASNHFRILSLVKNKKIGSDPEPFKRYVYPRELDKVLQKDRLRIEERINTLRCSPSIDHGLLAPLSLS